MSPLISRLGSHSVRAFGEFTKIVAHVKVWVKQTGASVKRYTAVCQDSTGTIIYTCVSGDYIQKSSDGGTSWSALTGSGSRTWSNICCNSSGTIIYASVSGASGAIYVSTNSGATWATSVSSTASSTWLYICCNDSGSIAYATQNSLSTTTLYFTVNSGTTWLPVTTITGLIGSNYLQGVCCNSTGTTVYVASAEGGPLGRVFVSTNTALTWSVKYSTSSGVLGPICCDSTGTIIYVSFGGKSAISSGAIQKSSNSGSTWGALSFGASQTDLVCDSTGTILTTYHTNTAGETVYVSFNSGTLFLSQITPGTQFWTGARVSLDGSKIVIVSDSFAGGSGYIWTYS